MSRSEAEGEDESAHADEECCTSRGPDLKKGLWTPEEDAILMHCVYRFKEGNWSTIAHKSGLKRSGKSCRLRWVKHLSPSVNTGPLTEEEQARVIQLQQQYGNKWALIAQFIPGRSDNTIKNFWNSYRKRMMRRHTTRAVSAPGQAATGASGASGVASLMGLSASSPLLSGSQHLSLPASAGTILSPVASNRGPCLLPGVEAKGSATHGARNRECSLDTDAAVSSSSPAAPEGDAGQCHSAALQPLEAMLSSSFVPEHLGQNVPEQECKDRAAPMQIPVVLGEGQPGKAGSEEVLSIPLAACSEILPSSPSESATDSGWESLEDAKPSEALSKALLAALQVDGPVSAALHPQCQMQELPGSVLELPGGVHAPGTDHQKVGHIGTSGSRLEVISPSRFQPQHPPNAVPMQPGTNMVPAADGRLPTRASATYQQQFKQGRGASLATFAMHNNVAAVAAAGRGDATCQKLAATDIAPDPVVFPAAPRYTITSRPPLPTHMGHQLLRPSGDLARTRPAALQPEKGSVGARTLPAPLVYPEGVGQTMGSTVASPMGSSSAAQEKGPAANGELKKPSAPPEADSVLARRQRQLQEAKRMWQSILDSPKGMCAALRLSMPTVLREASSLKPSPLVGAGTPEQKPRARPAPSVPASLDGGARFEGNNGAKGCSGSRGPDNRPKQEDLSLEEGYPDAYPHEGQHEALQGSNEDLFEYRSPEPSEGHAAAIEDEGARPGSCAQDESEHAKMDEQRSVWPSSSAPATMGNGGIQPEILMSSTEDKTAPEEAVQDEGGRMRTPLAQEADTAGDTPRDSKRPRRDSFRSRQPASLTITRTSLPLAAMAAFNDHCRTPENLLAFRTINSPSISALFASPGDCEAVQWVWDAPMAGQGTPGAASPPAMAH